MAELTGAEELVAASGRHPYVLAWLRHTPERIRGWSTPGAIVWSGHYAHGRGTVETRSIGDPEAVANLLAEVVPVLPPGSHLVAPTQAAARLAGQVGLAGQVRWCPNRHFEFQWTTGEPPPARGLDSAVRVLGLTDLPAVSHLLDRHSPDAEARPGHPAVRQWVGLSDRSGRLVAIAADTSGPTAGHLSSVATVTDQRGRGYGRAVAGWLTRALLAEFGLVTLGIEADNEPARKLYLGLGFGHHMRMSHGPLV